MSVKISDIYSYLNQIAPFSTQAAWDNSGFLIGDWDAAVQRIGVVLDITPETITEAIRHQIDLIISHHPVIFEAQKQFHTASPVYQLARNGIHALCAHTNLDDAEGGVNSVLAETLGLEGIQPFPVGGADAAVLRAGVLPETLSLDPAEFAAYIAQKLGTPLRYRPGSGKIIRRVAVCGGSGGSFIGTIADAGFDAYVTGDAGHHHFLEAASRGLTFVAAGHFETENGIVPVLAERLQQTFPGLDVLVLRQENPIPWQPVPKDL